MKSPDLTVVNSKDIAPTGVQEFVQGRFGVDETKSDISLPLYTSHGEEVDLKQWNTRQVDLVVDWIRLMVKEVGCGRGDHEYMSQVLESAPRLDIAKLHTHLGEHLTPEQRDIFDTMFTHTSQRVGQHMRTLCKYAGAVVDTAQSRLADHYSRLRPNIEEVTYLWNEAAGENSAPAQEVNKFIHEPTDAISIDARKGFALLFTDAQFPIVEKDSKGPHLVDVTEANIDDPNLGHKRELIIAPTQPFWIHERNRMY